MYKGQEELKRLDDALRQEPNDSSHLLHIAGLTQRPLWMGHLSKDMHGSLIRDINHIPIDWRDIWTEVKAVMESTEGLSLIHI